MAIVDPEFNEIGRSNSKPLMLLVQLVLTQGPLDSRQMYGGAIEMGEAGVGLVEDE